MGRDGKEREGVDGRVKPGHDGLWGLGSEEGVDGRLKAGHDG